MPSVTLIRYFCPNVAGWPISLGSHEVITQRVSPVILKNRCQHIGVTTSTCQGHVKFPISWPFDSPGAISYRCSIVTESVSPTIFEIKGIFYIWVTTLTFLGDVTSSVTWPFDSTGAISYRCSIVTESLSPIIFEIIDIFRPPGTER